VDGIIPLAVKRVAGDVEVSHFLIRDSDWLWIDVFIQFVLAPSPSERPQTMELLPGLFDLVTRDDPRVQVADDVLAETER
jgi:hypothetical protein